MSLNRGWHPMAEQRESELAYPADGLRPRLIRTVRRTCTTAARTISERAGALARSVDGSWLRSGVRLCMVNVWRG